MEDREENNEAEDYNEGDGRSVGGEGDEHPYVRSRRPDPAKAPRRSLTLEGLKGSSDRPGYSRIYFTRALNWYAEFRDEDVLPDEEEHIPPDQPPLIGLDATAIAIRRDAPVDFVHSAEGRALDEYDLGSLMGPPGPGGEVFPNDPFDTPYGGPLGEGTYRSRPTCGKKRDEPDPGDDCIPGPHIPGPPPGTFRTCQKPWLH